MAKLYFFYSAMNAGKTTSLLQSDHNYRQRGMNTVLYTSKKDDRSGLGVISSRIGLSREANLIKGETDLFADVESRHQNETIHCVFIDEAQFLTPAQVLQATMVCDRLNIPACLWVAERFQRRALDGVNISSLGQRSYRGQDGVPIRTKATMSARLSQDGHRVWEGEQVQIGYHYERSRHYSTSQSSPIGYPPRTDQGEPQNEATGRCDRRSLKHIRA